MRPDPRIRTRPRSAAMRSVWCHVILLGVAWVTGLFLLTLIGLLVYRLVSGTGIAVRTRLPPGGALMGAFVLVSLASAVQLTDAERVAAWSYRTGLHVVGLVALVAAYNLALRGRSVAPIVNLLAAVLVLTCVLGNLALFIPDHSHPGLLARFAPESSALLNDLTTVRLSAPSTFLSDRVPRPAAPFTYPNEFGSLAVILPLVVFGAARLAPSEAEQARVRRLAAVCAIALLPPLVFSLSRIAWVSLVVAWAFIVLKTPSARLRRQLIVVVAVATAVTALGFGGLISERIDTPHSDAGRSVLVQGALALWRDSPLLGHGAPQPVPDEALDASPVRARASALPSAGTHGQLWTVMVSQGLLGLATYFGTWLVLFMHLRRGGDRWLHLLAAVLALAIQAPYYEWLPYQQLVVLPVIGIALGHHVAQRKQSNALVHA
jgi:polysaccharide biosynthesis protein PslJ